VGSVITKNGAVISEGWHKKYGQPHAEAHAIANADQTQLEGATLYCNLEPCCHTKKQTPPCTPLIISHKIKRVVISNIDPNPKVAGEGVKQLREAGIEVISGICAEEGKLLNRFYFHFVKYGLPFITLKIARSLDGKITRQKGVETAVTGKEAKQFVHQLRSEYDAVIIGANTVNIDNPSLTVREVKGRNPIKIVIDGLLCSSPKAKLFDENTILFISDIAEKDKMKPFLKQGTKIITLKGKDGIIPFKDIFNVLAERKINSVLIEGGHDISSEILKQRMFDELLILQSAEIFGEGVEAFEIDLPIKLIHKSAAKIGDDLKIVLGKG
jgi:diaminohydroxyphosphoribosylaminopyrimidine deaminase/5-amino-6-(5-phosphoribosylamino)uracil reductase